MFEISNYKNNVKKVLTKNLERFKIEFVLCARKLVRAKIYG